MKPGDLVTIMGSGDPARTVFGMSTTNSVVHLNNSTYGIVIDIDSDRSANRTHVQILIRSQALWVSSRFVKVIDETR